MAIVHKSKPFGGYSNTSFGKPAPAKRVPAYQPPAAPVGSPAPDAVQPGPDAAYLAAIGANQQSYANILSQLPGLLNAAAADYGYSVNYTPGSGDINDSSGIGGSGSVGTYSVGGIDASNPNSRAAALQRAYQNQQKGASSSYAARGQLYSGALETQKEGDTRAYQANDLANQRSFANLISGYLANAGNARTNLLSGNAQAVGDLANRQALTPAPSTVTYAGGPYAPGTPDQPFASPVGAPTPASVLASKSLLGTDITKRPPASFYRPRKAR